LLAKGTWVYRSHCASQVTNLGKSTHWQDFELSRLPLNVHTEHPHNDSGRARHFNYARDSWFLIIWILQPVLATLLPCIMPKATMLMPKDIFNKLGSGTN